MCETKTTEQEIEIRLTKSGKLPREINCPLCGCAARRLFTRSMPTYLCKDGEECGAITTLSTTLT